MEHEKIIKTAIELGADKAGITEIREEFLDGSLRILCEQNHCGYYNRNYGCPPFAGTKEELIEKAKTYKYILLFQKIGQLEDSYDIEGMRDNAGKLFETLIKVRKALKNELAPKPLFLATSCRVCESCAALEKEPCKHPEEAVTSISAYCLNLSVIAPCCGMRYVNGQNTVTNFGAVLFN